MSEANIVDEVKVRPERDWGELEVLRVQYPELVSMRLTKAVVGKVYQLTVFSKEYFRKDRRALMEKAKEALRADVVSVVCEVIP
jgi:hypothetical protein